MIAQFIGVDSMGFVNGKIYNLYSDIHVFGDKLCIFLHDKNSPCMVPIFKHRYYFKQLESITITFNFR